MAKLSLKTQGVKGGNPKWHESVGYCAQFVDTENQHILVDVFEGRGHDYKQREKCLIEIAQNGLLLFRGTFEELTTKLKGA